MIPDVDTAPICPVGWLVNSPKNGQNRELLALRYRNRGWLDGLDRQPSTTSPCCNE
jgi:hypothetical protein